MESHKYILAIDQGTTSTRVSLINQVFQMEVLEQIEHKQIHQNPGWLEHDPLQIINNINTLITRISESHGEVV